MKFLSLFLAIQIGLSPALIYAQAQPDSDVDARFTEAFSTELDRLQQSGAGGKEDWEKISQVWLEEDLKPMATAPKDSTWTIPFMPTSSYNSYFTKDGRQIRSVEEVRYADMLKRVMMEHVFDSFTRWASVSDTSIADV